MSIPEHFKIEDSTRKELRVTPWVTFVLLLLSIAFPFFLPTEKNKNHIAAVLLGLSLVSAIGWGVATWYGFRVVRRLRLIAISVDEEGLWPSALPRSTSLVRWTDVVKVRERQSLQRLELLGNSGTVLLRIEYQLVDFERLRTIVFERTQTAPSSAKTSDSVYGMSPWHHAFTLGGLLAFAAVGWYVGLAQPWVGYGLTSLLIAFLGWDYLRLPYRVQLSPHSLEIAWPLKTRTLSRNAVEDIRLADDFVKGARVPYVLIHLRAPERPIRLKRFRQQSIELVKTLQAWRNGDAY